MTFESRDINGSMILDVDGELDVANSVKVRECLFALFKKFPKRVVLNLANVDCIGSSGLAMLVAALKKSNEMRVLFGICSIRKAVRVSLELTALQEIIPIFKDVDDALKNLNN